MADIITALKNTPIWVYLLFCYLIYIGLSACKARRAHILKLAILPAIFIGLLLQTLLADVGISTMTLSVGLLGLLIGATIGWLMVWRAKIEVEPQKFVLLMPGNWHTLLSILLILAAKYYYGFELERDPNIITLTLIETSVYFLIAICAGFSIGKFFNYLHHIKAARLS